MLSTRVDGPFPGWEIALGLDNQTLDPFVVLRYDCGDWPLSPEGQQEFRKKLSAALQQAGDLVWKRCLEAE